MKKSTFHVHFVKFPSKLSNELKNHSNWIHLCNTRKGFGMTEEKVSTKGIFENLMSYWNIFSCCQKKVHLLCFDRRFIQWISNPPYSMGICNKKLIRNSFLDLFGLTPTLSISSINPYMDLSKLLRCGTKKWIGSFITLDFLNATLSLLFIPND